MVENHTSSLMAIAIVSLIAAISPGADFFIVLRNSLRYSRKIGVMTAFGVAMGLLVHLAYTIIGMAVLIQENIYLYSLIKYAGAFYLFYLGCCCFYSSFKQTPSLDLPEPACKHAISHAKAFQQGFLTNLLNPKATLFFISLFSQFINPSTPNTLKIEYGLINWMVTLGWFCLLAYMVTGKLLAQRLTSFRLAVDRCMGFALILLSVKIMLF